MATSQNGYPASPDRAAIGVRTFQVPGRPDVEVPLRADIAPLILEFMRWWNDTVEPLEVPGCWGYAYRDINAPKHPLGAVGTGPMTRAAVEEFQRRVGLDVDGVVGPRTWERLGI